MLASERQSIIYNFVRRKGIVRTSELRDELGVSEMTVRRDIDILDEKNLVKKVRGGACVNDNLFAFDISERVASAADLAIAKAASQIADDGMSVAIDGSLLTSEAANFLKSSSYLTLITNNLNVFQSFKKSDNIRLIILGGMLSSDKVTLGGTFAADNAKKLSPDIFFFSCDGFGMDGVSTNSLNALEARKILSENAALNVLLAQSERYLKNGLIKIFDWDIVDILITDDGLDKVAKEALEIASPSLDIIVTGEGGIKNEL